MTGTIEQKALALVNEVLDELKAERQTKIMRKNFYAEEALCRAIEAHEAFRQEVSDAVEAYLSTGDYIPTEPISRFIIAKPDPLVEALNDMAEDDDWFDEHHAADLRAAIEKRGGKIVWGEG